MKYCRFQLNGQAHYGLVESVAGRDTILRILLTPPGESDGDVEDLRTRKIDAIALEEAPTRFVIKKNQTLRGVSEAGISEEFSTNLPRSFYGATKLAAECLVQEFGTETE